MHLLIMWRNKTTAMFFALFLGTYCFSQQRIDMCFLINYDTIPSKEVSINCVYNGRVLELEKDTSGLFLFPSEVYIDKSLAFYYNFYLHYETLTLPIYLNNNNKSDVYHIRIRVFNKKCLKDKDVYLMSMNKELRRLFRLSRWGYINSWGNLHLCFPQMTKIPEVLKKHININKYWPLCSYRHYLGKHFYLRYGGDENNIYHFKDSTKIIGIIKEKNTKRLREIEVPSTIVSYDFNNRFIIAKQKQLANVSFWIIDKRMGYLVGPLDECDFNNRIKELDISQLNINKRTIPEFPVKWYPEFVSRNKFFMVPLE